MKKTIYILLVVSFIVFLILSLVFNSKANNAIEESKKSLRKFSSTVNYTNSYTYVDDVSEDINGYLIVFYDNEPIIAYLNNDLLYEIKNLDLEKRNIKLVGDSFDIDDNVKENIMIIYNSESTYGDEDYLLEEDFESVFGTYYLDVTRIEKDNELHKTPKFLSSLFLDISLVSLLILGFKIVLDRRNH